MTKLKIISDNVLRKLKVKDNNEKLVDLRKQCPQLVFKIAYYIKINGGSKAVSDAYYARKSVANRLNIAKSLLPDGFKLKIKCAYRSPQVQQKSYDAIYKELKEEHLSWNKQQLEEEMSKRVSPVDIAPHCTGGAIDLTIVDNNNKPLDMGTGTDEFSEKTYTNSSDISKKAKNSRDLLIKTMTKAGFVNFPAEWWHWSYGDREWAFYQKDKTAIYDAIER